MTYKTARILFLWFLFDIALKCCGHLKNFPNSYVTNSNYSEEAMKRLLWLFGLDGEMPKHHENRPFLPPQYMLDLYKIYSENSLSDKKIRYSEANTVRSFFDKGDFENSDRYIFDLLGTVPKREEIVDAEFHFFTSRNISQLQNTSRVIQIQLYEGPADDNSKLLQARIASSPSSGWEVFKIKSSVRKWIYNPESNQGLTVKILDLEGNVWSSRRVHHLQNYRRPILIVFSRDPKTTKSVTHQNFKSSQSVQDDETRAQDNMSDISIIRRSRSVSVPKTGLCMRHELRVDFDKLGWSTWIISPKWYDAYVCAGTCTFPLGQNQRPTNHATVQSIVHELGLTEGIGAPCCVPTELHPVSLLYYDEQSNVVLKHYDDMVAAGCGCQ